MPRSVGCARVAFEQYGGSGSAPIVPCDGGLGRILQRSRLEETPPLVHLQGRTCDVTARAKRGEHHLTVDGLETPLSMQGDLQIPLSQDGNSERRCAGIQFEGRPRRAVDVTNGKEFSESVLSASESPQYLMTWSV